MPRAHAITSLNLASRASKLALTQTGMVAGALAPVACAVVQITTRGDEIRDRRLADIADKDGGGKGLFVKALEAALLRGQADAAIHSAKDMESDFAPGTMLAAILPRGDRRDALVSRKADSIMTLPRGAIIGTASVRRAAMLLNLRPDFQIKLLRGNVTTRVEQLNRGEYDAIILAMAGLERLGIHENVHPLAEDDFLPAAAQGAIAVQIRAPENETDSAIAEAVSALNHLPSRAEVMAERALVAALDGSCHTPIAASAHYDENENTIAMHAALLSPDGKEFHRAHATAPADDAEALGKKCAGLLLEKAGGRQFLDGMNTGPTP